MRFSEKDYVFYSLLLVPEVLFLLACFYTVVFLTCHHSRFVGSSYLLVALRLLENEIQVKSPVSVDAVK